MVKHDDNQKKQKTHTSGSNRLCKVAYGMTTFTFLLITKAVAIDTSKAKKDSYGHRPLVIIASATLLTASTVLALRI